MELLQKAVAEETRVRLAAGDGSTSVAELVPVRRSEGCVALGHGEKRYLRIVANAEKKKVLKVDMAGDRTGPWTEFRVTPDESTPGAINLFGVKSGYWLHVAKGDFSSLQEPEPLTVIPCGSSRGAEAQEDSTHEHGGEFGVLQVVGGGGKLPWPVKIDRKGGVVFLTTTSGKNVACGPKGKMHDHGGNGQWAQWVMEGAVKSGDGGVTFKNVGHERYLAFDDTGPTLADAPAHFERAAGSSEVHRAPEVNMKILSASDVAHFKEKGFLIMKGAVPPELIRNALRGINNLLGQPDCWVVDPNPLNSGQKSLKSGNIGMHIIKGAPLFWSALNVLLGEGNVTHRPGCQVALRFPQSPEAGFDVPDVKRGTRYHIDGMGQNRLCPFSVLCGVALSDQSKPNCGNLHVFPGSHLNGPLHEYYRSKIQDESQGESDDRKPDLGASTQVLLQPGDVVLAHQLLAHRVGVNTSEHIRYQIYFRVEHKDHARNKEKVIGNPWLEFAV